MAVGARDAHMPPWGERDGGAMGRWGTAVALFLGAVPGPALAGAPFACAGFAQLGGAQLLCSHTDPAAPRQTCTYSWTLAGGNGAPGVVQGSFMLEPGQQNVTVYQGAGFAAALAPPVVLCQGRKDAP